MPKVSETYLQERREEILEAAITCFRRKGFHETTMRDICEEAQVSPGAVYRYFKSKNEFVDAASDENVERIHKLIAELTGSAHDPREAVQRIGQYYYGLFDDPDFADNARMELELCAQSLRSEELRKVSLSILGTLRDTFSDLISKIPPPPGEDWRATPETVANLVIALWFGLQYTKAVDPKNVDTDAVFTLLQTLLSGAGMRVPIPTH